MGIMNLISKAKSQYREYQTSQNLSKAEKLKGLREERIRAEGVAKVDKAYNQEKARLKKAKQEHRQAKYGGLIKVVKGAKSQIKKHKPKNKGVFSSNAFGSDKPKKKKGKYEGFSFN
jgi:hypothetical protein